MITPFIGEISQVGFNFAPKGWFLCNGQLLPISQYTALFSLLGTTYGGDGRTTFALPNLQSQIAIGQGQGPGLQSYDMGETGGVETVTLLTSQIPAHNHTGGLTANSAASGSTNVAANNSPAVVTESDGNQVNVYGPVNGSAQWPITVVNTGGNQAHSNIQPNLALYYVIAWSGIFPSRP